MSFPWVLRWVWYKGKWRLRWLRRGENLFPRYGSPPSILIISIPKSGTVFLNSSFGKRGYSNLVASNYYFPVDQLNLNSVRDQFRGGGYVVSAHADPSPENLQILRAYVPKWVVHLRDPRSVTLSWTHHANRYGVNSVGTQSLRVTPQPPLEYFDATFAQQIDWQIDNFLPFVVRWMEQWLAVIDNDDKIRSRVMLTSFDQFRNRNNDFVNEIAAFIGAPQDGPMPEKTMATHFRTGSPDEWRTVFSDAQLARANALIPEALKSRFGWM